MRANKQNHQSVKQGRVSPITEDTGPVAFFKAVYQAFQQAEQASGGSIDRFYRIGGYTIRLRFAGSALVPRITPALEHLAVVSSSAPALTICLWDSVSTNTVMPSPPWRADDYLARGEIRGYNDDRIRIACHQWSGVLRVLDAKANLAVWWIRDARQLPSNESGSPLPVILQWWMGSHGRQYVHAGAVGTPTGGVLLAGRGGSGKSTTALACLDSELVYVGDDYCLLSNNPFPYVYSLYNSGKVNAEDIERFPLLKPALTNTSHLDTEKALCFIYEHFPEKTAIGFPLRAVLIPHVTGCPETTLTPASPVAGLKALVPSTIFQLRAAGYPAARFQAMAELIKQIPCYHLELGTNLPRIPDVILSLLSEV